MTTTTAARFSVNVYAGSQAGSAAFAVVRGAVEAIATYERGFVTGYNGKVQVMLTDSNALGAKGIKAAIVKALEGTTDADVKVSKLR